MPKTPRPADPAALRREAAGRYVSGDGRFSVEQESAGTWLVVDSAQTNDFGLPLVRGPFATLADAKAAVAAAREAPPVESPLTARLAESRKTGSRATDGRGASGAGGRRARGATDEPAGDARRRSAGPGDHPRRGPAGDARASAVRGPEREGRSATPPAPPPLEARAAKPGDAAEIARIYNAGIETHEATFETEPRSRADILRWLDGRHPVVVVTRGDEIVAFAATFEYRPRAAYRGVAEFSVYADAAHRREGAGRLAMETLVRDAAEAGFWKLVSRVFPENEGSRALLRAVGFREVGTYRRHARLDGEWRDCVIVERLIGPAAE